MVKASDEPKNPGYLIARVEVKDWERYLKYAQATPEVIARFGGKFIVRGGDVVTLEGETETRRLVIIEFPSVKKVQEFYHSPEYSRIKELRAGAAIGQFLAVDGIAG
jgi:uncharacterized protein (DUF1330 family)